MSKERYQKFFTEGKMRFVQAKNIQNFMDFLTRDMPDYEGAIKLEVDDIPYYAKRSNEPYKLYIGVEKEWNRNTWWYKVIQSSSEPDDKGEPWTPSVYQTDNVYNVINEIEHDLKNLYGIVRY